MGGWAKFLMGLNLLLLTAVVVVFGYDAWLAREERSELTQERVGEMIAQRVEERLGQYSNESSATGKSAAVSQPLSNEELRETIKASIEAALAAKPSANPAAASAESALQAASSFSIELGARTQELLERLTDQAASIAKIEAALPSKKAAAAAPENEVVATLVNDPSLGSSSAGNASVGGSPRNASPVDDSPAAMSSTELPEARLSDAALMARVIEGINAAPPTAAGPVAPIARLMKEVEGLAPKNTGMGLRLAEVHFSPSSTELSPGALRKTREAADGLKLLDAHKIKVVGFTDTRGSSEQNVRIASERAQNVAKMLARLGIPSERIEIIGRGEIGGPQSTLDDVDEPLNRCVGIIAVDYPGKPAEEQ